MYRIKPRQTIYGRKLKRWYRAIDGKLPVGWQNRPYVKVKNVELNAIITRIHRNLAQL